MKSVWDFLLGCGTMLAVVLLCLFHWLIFKEPHECHASTQSTDFTQATSIWPSDAEILDEVSEPETTDFDSPRPGAPPWEVNFCQNRRRSQIVRLPDELLLQIMQMARTSDLYMLRQVSFTFWRIYRGKEFAQFHTQRFRLGPFVNDPMTVLRAKQLAFCKECFKRRISPNKDFDLEKKNFQVCDKLACSACVVSRPRSHFAPDQRSQPAETRRCIICSGGAIRLCPHVTIPAQDIFTRIKDSNPSETAAKVTYERLQGFGCHQCLELALGGVHEAWKVHGGPYLELKKITHPSGNGFRMKYVWQFLLFVMPERGPITFSFLRQKLEEFERRHGSIICPHFKSRDHPIFRALDPQYCSCLGGDRRIGSVVPYNRATWGKHCTKSNMFSHETYCSVCDCHYSWQRQGNYVYLSRQFVSGGWLQVKENEVVVTPYDNLARLVDPVSFETDLNPETENTFWCKASHCRNSKDWLQYSRHLESMGPWVAS